MFVKPNRLHLTQHFSVMKTTVISHQLMLCFGIFLIASTPVITNAQYETAVVDELDIPEDSWPWWRGPTRMGEAIDNGSLPTRWSEEENIRWKAPITGRGHGSPIVIGDLVILATADEESGSQSLMAFNRSTGEEFWTTEVHPEGAMHKNEKASSASSTPATDGEQIYINFPNSGKVITTALSMMGDILWQREVTDYVVHQGYGSSPALYRNLVIVSADNKGGGVLAALNRENGDVMWSRERPELPNYPSPILLRINGLDQIILTGCDLISSFDPLTGDTNWEVEGATTECVTSTVTDGIHVYSSGGYPRNHVNAIVADGSNELAWERNDRVYVPSMLIKDGFLYAVLDAGIAACWNSEDGEEQWRGRLEGRYTASPVLAGDSIYVVNESGLATIFRASPDQFEILEANQLGSEALATPTICGGEIFMRVATTEGDDRREYLYCIAHN